ncbi:unnamed protein product [Cyprideis torosa]|uniref:USP domain-containing protein n=1 Tax=Cyprideis torosa TaxID=163714 RepID=A0A7R8X4W2_9CRUS|nr:unnamed protein product [Cyprideis torosa]CAG0912054.1 unnamed protein product [Cyprideis torosa]
MVHLKRFSFHDNSSSKLGIPVDFPRGQDLLDMSPYTSGPSEAQPGASTQYKLYATVCHLGGKRRRK